MLLLLFVHDSAAAAASQTLKVHLSSYCCCLLTPATAAAAAAATACSSSDPQGYAQQRLDPEKFELVRSLVEDGHQGLRWAHFDPKVRPGIMGGGGGGFGEHADHTF